MKKVIRLTETDLTRIVKRVIMEQEMTINGWSDEEVADFMNEVFSVELERDDLDFNSLSPNQQIKTVRKYITMTSDDDVIDNLNGWLKTKINI